MLKLSIIKIFIFTIFFLHTFTSGNHIISDNDGKINYEKKYYLIVPMNGDSKHSGMPSPPSFNLPEDNEIPNSYEIIWDSLGRPRRYIKRNSKKWTRLGPIWG